MKNINRKFLKSIILLIAFSSAAKGQTSVSGGIYSNTTWTLVNSPYIVVDTVVVFPGVTLTIQPGVIVKFANDKRLEIRQAKLIAWGTSTDSITFTSNSSVPTPGIWSDIFLNAGTDNLKFNYCNFKYANVALNGDNSNSNHSFIIKNSTFSYNKIGLTSTWCNYALIDSCNFDYNVSYGISGLVNAKLNFCNFLSNGIGMSQNSYGAYNVINNCNFYFNQFGITDLGVSTVEYSSFKHNQHGIIVGGYAGSYATIKNCVLDSNYVVGLAINDGDTIINNKIRYNPIGLTDSMNAYNYNNVITKNTIENNDIGIKFFYSLHQLNCNKICNNNSYDLYYNVAFGGNLNASNNYWCTSDSATTTAVVYDGYDDISLGLVNFMPLDTDQCYLMSNCNSPIANFSFIDSSLTIYFTDSSASSATSWLWDFGDSSISTQQNPVHIYDTDGTYNVCLTAINSCGADTICYSATAVSTGIIKNNISSKITIFPNPASDYLILTLPASVSKTEIKIFNMLGKLEYSSAETMQNTGIDVSGLTRGLHIIQIETIDKISRQKFIKK